MLFRIHTIVAGTDLSEGAADVLRSASGLAALTESELHVVHAVPPEGDAEAGLDEARLREHEARLREQVDASQEHGGEAKTCRVVAAPPAAAILQKADETHADLIVIGPHRERGAGDRALGTTADRIVRGSDGPCLVVHAPVRLPLRRILVPSDLSGAARGALDVALAWGSALRLPTASGEITRLEVLHVVPAGEARGAGHADALHAHTRDAIAHAGGRPPLDVGEVVVEGDDVAEQILGSAGGGQGAAGEGVDLLVMGTHGQSAHSRALIGSVSSVVARRARCPVLLVPPALWRQRSADEAGRAAAG